MLGFEHLGSICSGGRYDALASDGRTTYPGVGISLGVTRALGPLFSRGLLTASRSTPTCVLVALPAEEARGACGARGRGAAQSRRRRPRWRRRPRSTASRSGSRERRGIPFVWFPQDDGTHQVRDIRSGEQVEADPAAWVPPADDLRPTIIGTVAVSD